MAGRILGAGSESAVAGLDVADFVRDFRSRNSDILSEAEQAAVDAAKVLVAGCGTVGGSAVEPLVRLGVNEFVLADPDVYDVTNLNRQACFFADLGRPKPEVLAERVKAINPLATATVLTEGITPGNVEAAFEGVTFVCEGVDASMDLWAKYLVHHHAAVRRIPVVSGVDFGGKPTLYVFDYRFDSRPFYGQGTEADHRDGRVIEAIRWIGARPIPADFAPIIVDRLRTGSPWPQTVYTAWGIGAIMTRVLVDLALHRRVPHIIAVDFHDLVRRRRRRWLEQARWPVAVLRARREMARVEREGAVVTPSPERVAMLPGGAPRRLLPLVDAIRRAPSARNLQPWSITTNGEAQVRLVVAARGELPILDPDHRLLAQSLGCAIQAASSVADVAIEYTSGLERIEPGAEVATLTLERVRPDYSTAAALLTARRTNRRAYSADLPPGELLDELREAVAKHGVSASVIVDRASLAELADVAGESISSSLADTRAREELLRSLRVSSRAGAEIGTGMAPEALLAGEWRAVVLRAAALRPSVGSRLDLGRMLAAHTRHVIHRSGAILVLDWGSRPPDWIAAGRAMMAAWLLATRAGWAVHPVSVPPPVDRHASTLRSNGLDPTGSGLTLMRIGRAGPAPHTPRLPLERIAG